MSTGLIVLICLAVYIVSLGICLLFHTLSKWTIDLETSDDIIIYEPIPSTYSKVSLYYIPIWNTLVAVTYLICTVFMLILSLLEELNDLFHRIMNIKH